VHVSATFLLPVFEKSVIINDFQAIAHSISAREGGSTVCCNRRLCDVLVPLQTPNGETTRTRSWRFRSDATKLAHRLGTLGLAICLFWRLCTKTRPKCGFGPVGLAFRALHMHQAPIIRHFDVRLAVSDMLHSTPTTPSVEEFNYTTLSIVFLVLCYTGGGVYRIVIFWTGKSDFRLTSNISAVDRPISTKFADLKEDIFCYKVLFFRLLQFAVPPLGGQKLKSLPPNFFENRGTERRYCGIIR